MNCAKSKTGTIRALTTWLVIVSTTNATVETVSKSYPCCGSPEIRVDDLEDCEQTWDSADMNIAAYHPNQLAHPPGCHVPCTSVSLGKLSMDRCLNVTLKMVCTDSDGNVKWEKNTDYCANTENCPVTPEAIVKSVTTNNHNQSPHRHYGLLAAVVGLFALIGLLLCTKSRGNHCNHIQGEP